MVIVIDDEKLLKFARRTAIFLVACAVLLFLVLSGFVFRFSEREPYAYQMNYLALNTSGKAVATSMRKTGEVEDTVLNNKNAFRNTKKQNKKNAFFDAVSDNHRDDGN